jgi:hypothetical protein
METLQTFSDQIDEEEAVDPSDEGEYTRIMARLKHGGGVDVDEPSFDELFS